MPYCLLLSRSITNAQRMCRVLEEAGITARYFRPPAGLTNRGCAYAVRVGERDLKIALQVLRKAALPPGNVFLTRGDGIYQEVSL